MSIVHNGIVKCPSCGKFFETGVSYFKDYESKEEMEKAKRTENKKTCPYCQTLLSENEWWANVVYNPTMKENKMSKEEILKIQPDLQEGSTVFVENKKPGVIDKIKSFFGLK